MSINVNDKNIGHATAYAYYKAGGGTMTEAEFTEFMADFGTASQTAVEAAQAALASKNAAQTAATTATTKASEAATSATTATTAAEAAQADADAAALDASQALSAASTATTKATEATTAAATAVSAKDDAVSANTAAQSAKTAAQTAQTGAETAAASVQSSAAQIQTNAEDISELKEDFAQLTVDDVEHSEQLLNIESKVTGAIQSNGSVSDQAAWENYSTSDYIPVESGKTYTFYLIKSDNTQPTAAYRLLYCLFDASKSPLSYFNTDNLNQTTITPGQDGYIRVSCGDVSSQQYAFSKMAMLIEGETLIPYQEYYYTTTKKIANDIHLNTLQKSEAAGAAIDETTSDSTHIGTTIIEPEWTSGYCNKSGVIITPSNDYKYSQLIDVSQGDYIQCYDATNEEYCNFRYVTAYSNGSAVSASGQEGGYAYTVPSGVDQVRITALVVMDLDNSTIYNKGTITEKKIKDTYLPSIGNVLYRKKWAVCGDSFTAYTNKVLETGDYAGSMATYPFIIGNRNEMTIIDKFASSGRTLAYPSDESFTNSLCCPTDAGYYQNIPLDVDYITIMLGINDYDHSVSESQYGESTTGEITLGTIDDATTETYYGAWNVVLGWLRENRPFAHIGIIITNGIGVQAWVEAIMAVAQKWGYPTLNLNGDDRCPAMIRSYNLDVPANIKDIIKQKQAVDYDGTQTGAINTHPNWQTHELESTFIENFLRSI